MVQDPDMMEGQLAQEVEVLVQLDQAAAEGPATEVAVEEELAVNHQDLLVVMVVLEL